MARPQLCLFCSRLIAMSESVRQKLSTYRLWDAAQPTFTIPLVLNLASHPPTSSRTGDTLVDSMDSVILGYLVVAGHIRIWIRMRSLFIFHNTHRSRKPRCSRLFHLPQRPLPSSLNVRKFRLFPPAHSDCHARFEGSVSSYRQRCRLEKRKDQWKWLWLRFRHGSDWQSSLCMETLKERERAAWRVT
jgi:hypothetical protein